MPADTPETLAELLADLASGFADPRIVFPSKIHQRAHDAIVRLAAELAEAKRELSDRDRKDCRCTDPARRYHTYPDGYVLCLTCLKKVEQASRTSAGAGDSTGPTNTNAVERG